jgi:hypothetical protein
MHRIAKLLIIVSAFAAAACTRVSSNDARLIGEWSIPTGDVDDNGAYATNKGFDLTTLKPDHTFSQISHHTALPPAHVLSGSWHADGQQLVLKFTWAHPSMQDMVGQELRLIIFDVQRDHFMSANAQNDKQKMMWTRVK